MRKMACRIDQVHLKDLKAGMETNWDEGITPHEAFKELGNGYLDIPKIIECSLKIGVDQCHVEQDQSPAPLDSIVTSANYLRKLGS